MGSIQYSGQGLDPNILIEFPIIKYHKKSDSNIRFHGDGFVFSHSSLNCACRRSNFSAGPILHVLFASVILKLGTTSEFCLARTHFIRAAL
jgi:hypothetical protein